MELYNQTKHWKPYFVTDTYPPYGDQYKPLSKRHLIINTCSIGARSHVPVQFIVREYSDAFHRCVNGTEQSDHCLVLGFVAAYGYTNYFCPDGQVTFMDQSHGVGSAITDRLWIFEPGSTSTQHDPTYIFPVTDTTYIVTLIVTDDKGCKDTTTENVYVKPAFSLTFTNDTVCFKNTTYAHAVRHTYTNPGIYQVRLMIRAGVSGQTFNDTAGSLVTIGTVTLIR